MGGGSGVVVGGRRAAADVPGRGVWGAGERAGRSSITDGSAGSLSRRPGANRGAVHTLKNDKNYSFH